MPRDWGGPFRVLSLGSRSCSRVATPEIFWLARRGGHTNTSKSYVISISISIATAGRPARSGQARATRRTQTAPHTSGYAPKLHIHHHRAVRTASALRRMSSCNAERVSRPLAWPLARWRRCCCHCRLSNPSRIVPSLPPPIPPHLVAPMGLTAPPRGGLASCV